MRYLIDNILHCRVFFALMLVNPPVDRLLVELLLECRRRWCLRDAAVVVVVLLLRGTHHVVDFVVLVSENIKENEDQIKARSRNVKCDFADLGFLNDVMAGALDFRSYSEM